MLISCLSKIRCGLTERLANHFLANMTENRDLRIIAIFVVLAAGALGVLPAIVKQLSDATLSSTWFAIVKVCGDAEWTIVQC